MNPAFYGGGEPKQTEKIPTTQSKKEQTTFVRTNKNSLTGEEKKEHKNASRSLPKNQPKGILDNFEIDYKDTTGKRNTRGKYRVNLQEQSQPFEKDTREANRAVRKDKYL